MGNDEKNRTIVLAIVEGGLSQTEAATQFEVSTRWIRNLLARYKEGGLDALATRSRRPHTSPNATPADTISAIIELRRSLTDQGLDAGPESIWDRLPEPDRPSRTTIWRILHDEGLITPQPHKRPRSSWHRFEADAPNGCWQSDFTHWPLADGTDAEIISWLDDHSRYLLHITAHAVVTGPIVLNTFITTMDEHGPPAATLTDNGMVYTTRLARGRNGSHTQPNGFEQLLADLGIDQKNGHPGHPTTQGKIERFHQTLKRFLDALPLCEDLDELNSQLDQFHHTYNTARPHRAIGRRTPEQAYQALPKAEPHIETADTLWRVRYDRVDKAGKLTLRYAGRLRHLGIGRAHARTRVILLIHHNRTMVIDRDAGEIIAEHILDPSKNYQPRQKPQRSPGTRPER